MHRRLLIAVLLPLALASCLAAQDTRTVLEPFFPPICGSVDAQFQTVNGDIAPTDEQKLDTARIQKAIDRCGKGRALMLRVNEEKNAFLSGPLVLRPDITLILGRGVTLFASRDARLYDVTPGSCGVVDKINEAPPGCKALINVDHASNTGIMGDGVIDGRGVVTRLVSVDNSNNFTLYRITLRNSAELNLTFDHGSGLTLWGVHVKAADGATGKMGRIAIGSRARDVAITRSYIDSGTGQTEIVLSDAPQPAP
jgi:polygalacturonase